MNFSASTFTGQSRHQSFVLILICNTHTHAHMHMHAKSVAYPAGAAQNVLKAPLISPKNATHNAHNVSQRVVSCLDMLTALFMPRPRRRPLCNCPLRLIYVPALFPSPSLAVICLVTSEQSINSYPFFYHASTPGTTSTSV